MDKAVVDERAAPHEFRNLTALERQRVGSRPGYGTTAMDAAAAADVLMDMLYLIMATGLVRNCA
jgi:hypothetical protein